MEDICTRKDIENLVTGFYDKVRQDPAIGYIFDEVMKVNWNEHLPVMFDFWASILLGETTYQRNAMGIHFEVNQKVKLEQQHFDLWIHHFHTTIDELFEGPVANMAKKRAKSIADVMFFKMNSGDAGLSIAANE